MSRWTFTSESVTEGHPDKMADQISDAVLDALLAQDPMSRVACETLLTTGLVVVAGEITTTGYVEIPKLVRDVVTDIGYTSSDVGFDGRTCGVSVSIGSQSPDIAQGVDIALEVRAGSSGEDILNAQGAGDQGMMFGYACDETEDLMPPCRSGSSPPSGPAPVAGPQGRRAALSSARRQDPGHVRVRGRQAGQAEDGADLHPAQSQHRSQETLLLPDLPRPRDHPVGAVASCAGDGYKILANPTGKFELGGPHADAGLTGRKIIVDTYGGSARHGGGAFSGKDPSKVDRSAAYAARWVAKHVVASGAASRCEIQVAYAIGVARPVSIMVETFGTEAEIDPDRIVAAVDELFDLRPAAIIRDLDLRRPIYRQTASYGHFGLQRQGTSPGSSSAAWTPSRRPSASKSSPLKKGGRRAARPALFASADSQVVRVVTDVAGIDKEFDYLVPPGSDDRSPRSEPSFGSTWAAARWGPGSPPWAPIRSTAWPCAPTPKSGDGGRKPSVVDLAAWAAWRFQAEAAILLPALRFSARLRRRPPAARPPISGPPPAPGPDVRRRLTCAGAGHHDGPTPHPAAASGHRSDRPGRGDGPEGADPRRRALGQPGFRPGPAHPGGRVAGWPSYRATGPRPGRRQRHRHRRPVGRLGPLS